MTITEAADYLHVSKTTLIRYERAKILVPQRLVRLSRRDRYYTKDQLDLFIADYLKNLLPDKK